MVFYINSLDFTNRRIEAYKEIILNNKITDKSYSKEQIGTLRKNAKLFTVKDNNLLYKGKIVVPDEQVKQLVIEKYQDPAFGLIGINRFYNKLSQLYINISKAAMMKHLKNIEIYQIHKQQKKETIVKPTKLRSIARRIYFMDLIDISKFQSQNKHFHFILTLIDSLSKKGFAFALKNKEAASVKEGLESLLQKTSIQPAIIRSDNGSEFKNDIMTEFLITKGIRQVYSLPYKSTSQGMIEKFNNTLEQLLKRNMTLNQNNNWIDDLQTLVDNYNNTRHTVTKAVPNKVSENKPDQLNAIKNRINKVADEKIADNNLEPLQVRNKVRIRLLALESHVRKDEKTNQNKYKPQFSNEIYEIEQVFRNALQNEQYKLKELNRKFFRYDLLRVHPKKLIKTEVIQKPSIPRKEQTELTEKLANQETLLQGREPRTIQKPKKFTDEEILVPTKNKNIQHIETTTKTKAPVYDFIVEKILEHRGKGKGIEYLVKWKDYDKSFNTYEPPSSFPAGNVILKQYRKDNKL